MRLRRRAAVKSTVCLVRNSDGTWEPQRLVLPEWALADTRRVSLPQDLRGLTVPTRRVTSQKGWRESPRRFEFIRL
jgi:hypothetical protein